MSFEPLARGKLAAVVTSLELAAGPPARPLPASPFRLVPWTRPRPESYRTLFERVGAPWLWYSRLAMPDPALLAIIHHPDVWIGAVADRAGVEVGLLELDWRETGTCKIAFFGLVPEVTGHGHGRWLMGEALARGWRKGVERMWVHTCTLDHPSALNFYRAQGFVPFARSVEIFDDPRLFGVLPRDAAPQIPLLEAADSRR